jgi:hypothetical protein
MRQTEAFREQEFAEIRRWFSHGEFGTMFHGDDGRAWPMAGDVAAQWEREGQTVVDEFLADRVLHNVFGVFIAACVFMLVQLIGSLLDLGSVTGQAAVMGFLAAHLADLNLHYFHTRRMRSVKARNVTSLATTAPFPRAIAAPRRRTNMWRVLTFAWVMMLLALASSDMLFGDYRQLLMCVLIGGIGVAWALYMAAQRVDFLQRQDDFRRDVRVTPAATASPPLR